MSSLVIRAAAILGAIVVTLIALFFIGVMWPLDEADPIKTHMPLAFIGVTIVDAGNASLIPNQTVVVRDRRIVDVGNANEIAVPADAQAIEADGKFLIPALWDMHAHVYAVSPLLDLPLYIAHGVTNVRDMQGCPQPNDPFIACADEKRAWSRQAEVGEIVGPRIVGMASFMANGSSMLDRMPDLPEFFATSTPEQARAFVRHFAGQVDAIKVYDRIPRDAYFALVDEANRLGLDVVGHRPHAVSAIEAAARQKSLDHARFILHESFEGSAALRELAGTPQWREDRQRMLDEHDPQAAADIIAAMGDAGTWYVPTHLTRWVDAYAESAAVREDPLLRYLHPLLERQWREDIDETIASDPSPAARQTYRDFYSKGLELTGAAHRAGVKILAGSDYIVAGADVHRELEQLVMAGLTPAAALRAATLAPAEYFGLENSYGSVQLGQVADLVLLDADPLQDIRNTQRIDAVVFNGNLYTREDLDRLLDHVQRRARNWSVGCKIILRFLKNPVGY